MEGISISNNFTLREAERAQAALQNFDPAGVAAIDLTESLQIQLARRNMLGSLEYRIVTEFLDSLARKKVPEIARKLGVTTESVNHAAEEIATLTPDPGAEFDPT